MGRRALLWMAAAAALGAAFAAGVELHPGSGGAPGTVKPRAVGSGLLRQMVLRDLERYYYRQLPARARTAATVVGMLHALNDPYTLYLSPASYRRLQRTESGSYAGVGLALVRGRRGLVVAASPPGLPGREAGIQRGDVITTVDGASLASLPYGRAVEMMRGAAGSRVELQVLRPGHPGVRRLTLVRRLIPVPVITSRRLRANGRTYTYLRLSSFPGHTAERVRAVALAAIKRHDTGMVLDLRGNPGGLLSEAVDVVRVFLNHGVVVSTVGLHDPRQRFVAAGSAVGRLRLAVLIDGATASAAEVTAGALQRAGRAIVLGSRSYGKGTVQALRPLPGGGALKLTVAIFRLAGGKPVNRCGVVPGITAVDQPGTARDEVVLAALRALSAA